MTNMDFMAEVIVYPFVILFMAGLIFIHLGLRSRSSLTSLISTTLLIAWKTLAHRAIHLFLDRDGELTLERFGTYSAHPNFDAAHIIITSTLAAVFCISFFLTAISISVNDANRIPKLLNTNVIGVIKTRTVWALVVFSVAISLLSTIWYRKLFHTGENPTHEIILAIISLIGVTCSVLLAGIAIRRQIVESRGT